MKLLHTGVLSMVVGLAVAPLLQLSAQQPRMGHGGARMARAGFGVERLMGAREYPELTDNQIGELEELRVAGVEWRKQRANEMIELRSQVQAGLLDRDAAREQMVSHREEMRSFAEQRREFVSGILTDEQKEQIREARGAMRHEGFCDGAGFGGHFGHLHRGFGPGFSFGYWP